MWAGFAEDAGSSGSSVAEIGGVGLPFTAVDLAAGRSSSGPVKAAVCAAVEEVQALVPELADDRLRIHGLVGRGGFATVYRGALLKP